MSGGGGAPAVQAQYSYSSPFQNPAYNAVAMGTKQSPGPIARSIQIGNQLAQNWQDSYTGANPGAYYGVTKEQATPQFLANQRVQQGAWSPSTSQTASGVNQFDPERNRMIAAVNPNLPTQTPTPGYTPTAAAAQGGLMSLGNFERGRSSDEAVNPQGYAKGGVAKPKYNAKSSADDKLSALQTAIDGGYKPKPAETKFMQGMADSAAARQQLGSDVPFSIDPKTGAIKPAARGANQSSADYKAYLGKLDAAGATLDPKMVKQYGVTTGAAVKQQDKTSGVNAPYSMQQAVEQKTAYFDPVTGESTNPLFNQAVDEIKAAQQLPGQFGQATDAYNQAIKGLQGMTNYQAQDVTGRDAQAAAMQAASMQGREAQAAAMQAASMQAARANRGDIRDINAIRADVERYQAAGMQAPPALQAEMYDAAQAQAAQMAGPERVEGQTYQAAQIAPTRKERAATTTAPKTWTDPGVAQQYMNPYAQAVINQNVQEANRNFQKNLSALRGQAAKSKAYGGSRQGLEEAEALRNQGYLIADIQDKGLSQAYQQGMGQFQAEQGLGSQVGMSNTQAINQLKSQYMQMGLTEAQANQAAINQASQFGAQSAQQAALANQQAGLTAGQANLTAAQQTVLANQQALNNQRSLYVQQALDAAKTSYGGELTAAQQNQVAQNAAAQFNSQSQNQAYNNYVAQQLQAQQANQGMDWNTVNLNTQNQQAAALANAQFQQQAAQLNAQNQQQAELANQQYGLGGFQSNLQNAQFSQAANQLNAQNQQQANLANQLYGVGGFNAQQANQAAGLQANQQNIGAYGQALQGAQGLGALGASQAQTNLANIGALGQAAQAKQGLAQQYLNNVQQSAQNYYNFPQQQLNAPISAINQLPSSGGVATQTQRPGSAMGWKKGGLMNLRKARGV